MPHECHFPQNIHPYSFIIIISSSTIPVPDAISDAASQDILINTHGIVVVA